MNIIDRVIDFSIGIYEETSTVPEIITLPLPAFDRLVDLAAERMRQVPSRVPGTIPEVQLETGFGIVRVRCAMPDRVATFTTSPVRREDK